jgi:hypothetical protein
MLSRLAARGRKFSKDRYDPSRSSTTLLAEELRNNPMFDKAFPHLSKFKGRTLNEIPQEELGFIKSLL